jgi:probable rRNA maturation factor
MSLKIDITVESGAWSQFAQAEAATRAAVDACVAGAEADVADDEELSVLLCDDARIRELNRDFRGLDKATNVLSFPAAATPGVKVLGDVAIAYETVAREASDEGKSFGDHYAHMVVHGLLHILGYDHEADDEAEEMEALERVILNRMGIADPHAIGDGDTITR